MFWAFVHGAQIIGSFTVPCNCAVTFREKCVKIACDFSGFSRAFCDQGYELGMLTHSRVDSIQLFARIPLSLLRACDFAREVRFEVVRIRKPPISPCPRNGRRFSLRSRGDSRLRLGFPTKAVLASYARAYRFVLYPLGFVDCQRQLSAHMRSRSYSATHPSSSRALSQAA